jgi:hypothetical protein
MREFPNEVILEQPVVPEPERQIAEAPWPVALLPLCHRQHVAAFRASEQALAPLCPVPGCRCPCVEGFHLHRSPAPFANLRSAGQALQAQPGSPHRRSTRFDLEPNVEGKRIIGRSVQPGHGGRVVSREVSGILYDLSRARTKQIYGSCRISLALSTPIDNAFLVQPGDDPPASCGDSSSPTSTSTIVW